MNSNVNLTGEVESLSRFSPEDFLLYHLNEKGEVVHVLSVNSWRYVGRKYRRGKNRCPVCGEKIFNRTE